MKSIFNLISLDLSNETRHRAFNFTEASTTITPSHVKEAIHMDMIVLSEQG